DLSSSRGPRKPGPQRGEAHRLEPIVERVLAQLIGGRFARDQAAHLLVDLQHLANRRAAGIAGAVARRAAAAARDDGSARQAIEAEQVDLFLRRLVALDAVRADLAREALGDDAEQ